MAHVLKRNPHAETKPGRCTVILPGDHSTPVLAAPQDVRVLLHTSAGNIELELDKHKAPVAVNNFVEYVNSGFYNNTIFHRVIPGFMLQGGGFNQDLTQKTTQAPIKNEAD